ncbi:MAG: hypothetical protein ABI210_14230 [Abditibacteriaceae bacterium]
MENNHSGKDTLLYGGILAGVLLGAAASTWIWRQRVQILEELNASPEDRAEDIIASVEKKLASIEMAVAEIQGN